MLVIDFWILDIPGDFFQIHYILLDCFCYLFIIINFHLFYLSNFSFVIQSILPDEQQSITSSNHLVHFNHYCIVSLSSSWKEEVCPEVVYLHIIIFDFLLNTFT